MDARSVLERSIAATEGIVRDVDARALENSTPCTEWDVHALINHLIGDLWLLEGALTGKPPRYAPKLGGLPDRDLVGDDGAAAYKEAADAVLAAATTEALTGAVMMSGAITTDVVVHGWDLATATGQRPHFDENVVEYLLAFVRKGITSENRSPAFGAPIEVASSAPAIDRLVGFLGRNPNA